jgi:hypothetical protein
MNQLSLTAGRRSATDRGVRASTLHDFADARARRRAAHKSGPVCHWRRDPTTGALHCVWTALRGAAHEPASPVPL